MWNHLVHYQLLRDSWCIVHVQQKSTEQVASAFMKYSSLIRVDQNHNCNGNRLSKSLKDSVHFCGSDKHQFQNRMIACIFASLGSVDQVLLVFPMNVNMHRYGIEDVFTWRYKIIRTKNMRKRLRSFFVFRHSFIHAIIAACTAIVSRNIGWFVFCVCLRVYCINSSYKNDWTRPFGGLDKLMLHKLQPN